MHKMKNNSGFTLLELLMVIMIVSILGAIAITSYIGIRDKAKNATLLETASAADTELKHWLQSSISWQGNVREIDTDFNGVVDVNDITNGGLQGNVVAFYVNGRNTFLNEVSPWFDQPLWNSNDPPIPGSISLTQTGGSTLTLIATEKNGMMLAQYTITLD